MNPEPRTLNPCPEETIHTRSLMLSAPGEGLIAKMDLVDLSAAEAIPVDYKRGRVPDVPGVQSVAGTRERALSAALTTTGRVRAWLERHGDEAGIPRIWRPDVAGEVAAGHEPDGYEVNATLPPVSSANSPACATDFSSRR